MPGIDIKKAEEAFNIISRFENSSIKELVRQLFKKIFKSSNLNVYVLIIKKDYAIKRKMSMTSHSNVLFF